MGKCRMPSIECSHLMAGNAFVIGQVQALPVTMEHLQTATPQDPILSKLLCERRMATQLSHEYQPYLNSKFELSTEGDCFLWGSRVIIPQKLQVELVKELHHKHPGVTRIKAVVCSHLWWPGLDKDLEECARRCLPHQAVTYKNAPAIDQLHPCYGQQSLGRG